MKISKALFVLVLVGHSALSASGETRTWTDSATNRTIEGEFLKAEGDTASIKLANGRTVDVSIKRLADSDREFIAAKTAELFAATTGPLATITPPVSAKTLAVEGSGDSRKATFRITNDSEKAVSTLALNYFLYLEDESFDSRVGDRTFKDRGKVLNPGESYEKELSSFFIKDNIKSVDGMARELTWNDGTKWPFFEGPASDPEGGAPISIAMKGVVRQGKIALPLIEFFNHSEKGVTALMYRLYYLDAEGNELSEGRRTGRSNGKETMIPAGEGVAFFGNEGPPENAVGVRFSLHSADFADGSSWESED